MQLVEPRGVLPAGRIKDLDRQTFRKPYTDPQQVSEALANQRRRKPPDRGKRNAAPVASRDGGSEDKITACDIYQSIFDIARSECGRVYGAGPFEAVLATGRELGSFSDAQTARQELVLAARAGGQHG